MQGPWAGAPAPQPKGTSPLTIILIVMGGGVVLVGAALVVIVALVLGAQARMRAQVEAERQEAMRAQQADDARRQAELDRIAAELAATKDPEPLPNMDHNPPAGTRARPTPAPSASSCKCEPGDPLCTCF
jgi:hypothetical protein